MKGAVIRWRHWREKSNRRQHTRLARSQAHKRTSSLSLSASSRMGLASMHVRARRRRLRGTGLCIRVAAHRALARALPLRRPLTLPHTLYFIIPRPLFAVSTVHKYREASTIDSASDTIKSKAALRAHLARGRKDRIHAAVVLAELGRVLGS